MTDLSPSGKRVVDSSGPLSAQLVFIGESPAQDEVEQGIPFVGKAGKQLNIALRHAGIDRSEIRLMNLVPVRAPGDHFADHDLEDLAWGKARLRDELQALKHARVFVALGANPTEWLLGGKPPVVQRGESRKEGFIGQWRGSVLPAAAFKLDYVEGLALPAACAPEDYLSRLNLNPPGALPLNSVVIPTFHPAAILRQMNWSPWFLMDIAKAAKIAKDGVTPTVYRKWYIQDVEALKRLVKSDPDLISVDSELEPWVIGIATEDEVHVFEWSEEFRAPLTALLTSARVMKVAHNWTHDFAFFRKCLKIKVARPIFDTQGAAHILNTALQKELSPHIASRFTNWPYHKWLANHDILIYCGMDSVVCFDAYWAQLRSLQDRGLMPIAEHDHRLLMPLMEMTATGFKIDEVVRQEVEDEIGASLLAQDAELQKLVEPIVEKKLASFEKPHLFRVMRKCDCCGGGKTQRIHCERCALEGRTVCWVAETQSVDLKKTAEYHGFKTIKTFKLSWPECVTCRGSGKVVKKLEFNSDSPEQIADVVFRGLGVRARKFKGKETTKAAQLDPIKDKHPIIAKIVEVSETRADHDTVARLHAGGDGLLHCIFDPFGTGSGRVASKEGLLEAGTNGQNLPKPARRFVVPRDGFIFLQPDMSQIEARVVAVLSKDKRLIEAFNVPINWPGNKQDGKIDSHTRVVQLMLGSGAEITRQQAKRLTYAVMYGGRAEQLVKELNAESFRMGDDLRLTVKQVQYMIDVFFRVFSGVKLWQENIVDEVYRTSRLRNPLTGREFTWAGYLRDKKTKELKYESKKQVWSRLPQDTAAFVLALGLNAMYYESGEWGGLLTPVQHGHDALLIETPLDRVEEGKALATKLLTQELWGIKFPADMKTGMNWFEASGGG